MKAVLLLEDGTVFEGTSIGAEGSVIGEVVFHTGMVGYQETLTDPSYYGQIVTMTYPLIGNYGINDEDDESERPQLAGLVVREVCDFPNNWRSTGNLKDYLLKAKVVGIEGIDTRALTRLIRERGTMNGMISTDPSFCPEIWLEKLHACCITNPVSAVTRKERIHFPGSGLRIALVDYGVRSSTLNSLRDCGCESYLFPSFATAQEILEVEPDGIILSEGPGNPKDNAAAIETIKDLLGKKPMFGMGLGHQMIALACGADTGKLKYGHRGANLPVKDVKRNITYITSQNHGYVVLEDSLDKNRAEITHVNMNDGTIEGLRYLDIPVFSIQFQLELGLDDIQLLDDFIRYIQGGFICR